MVAIDHEHVFTDETYRAVRQAVAQNQRELPALLRERTPQDLQKFWKCYFDRHQFLQDYLPYFFHSVILRRDIPKPASLPVPIEAIPVMRPDMMYAFSELARGPFPISPVYVPELFASGDHLLALIAGNGMMVNAGIAQQFLRNDDYYRAATSPGWKAVGSVPFDRLQKDPHDADGIRIALAERGLVPATLTEALLAVAFYDAGYKYPIRGVGTTAYVAPGQSGPVLPALFVDRDIERRQQLQVTDFDSPASLGTHVLAVWPEESILRAAQEHRERTS